jgi:hypothetical protein
MLMLTCFMLTCFRDFVFSGHILMLTCFTSCSHAILQTYVDTYNCGDLVFSGHMLMAISYTFTAVRYCPVTIYFTTHMSYYCIY